MQDNIIVFFELSAMAEIVVEIFQYICLDILCAFAFDPPHPQDDWTLDKSSRPCDDQGWRYAVNFVGCKFDSKDNMLLYSVRKRRWVRHQQIQRHGSTTDAQRAHTGRYRFELVSVYENERRIATSAYDSDRLLPTDPHPFSDESGKSKLTREELDREADSVYCVWKSDWQVTDFETGQGWMYAFDFKHSYTSNKNQPNLYVRRRRWVQIRQWEVPLPPTNTHNLTSVFRSVRDEIPLLNVMDVVEADAKHRTPDPLYDNARIADIFDARRRSRDETDVPQEPTSELGWLQLVQEYSGLVGSLEYDTDDRCARFESQAKLDECWNNMAVLNTAQLLSHIVGNLGGLMRLHTQFSSVSDKRVLLDAIKCMTQALLERILCYVQSKLTYIEMVLDHPDQVDLLLFIGESHIAQMKIWQQRIKQV